MAVTNSLLNGTYLLIFPVNCFLCTKAWDQAHDNQNFYICFWPQPSIDLALPLTCSSCPRSVPTFAFYSGYLERHIRENSDLWTIDNLV